MKKIAAVFLSLAFGATTFASAADEPDRPARKAAAAAAGPAVAKSGKPEAGAVRGNGAATAREAFSDPYATPLLLNAKPLMIGRP